MDNTEAVKEELRAAVADLKQSKKAAETGVVEVEEAIQRRKQELEMYESRLKEWGRREEVANAKQAELAQREKMIKARESDLASRDSGAG